MKTLTTVLALLVGIGGLWAQEKKADGGSLAGAVVVIKIGEADLLNSRRIHFIKKALQRASDDRAEAVILELNTPGGLASESFDLVADSLLTLEVPSISLVNRRAFSVGALLALGTKTIYMAPSAVIGGASAVAPPIPPVEGEAGEDRPARTEQRVSSQLASIVKANARSAAAVSGHDPKLAEAFVDAAIEFKIGEEVISAKGELLTLTAAEAAREVDGKPLLAKGIAKSVEEVVQLEELTGKVLVAVERSFEKDIRKLGGADVPKTVKMKVPKSDGDAMTEGVSKDGEKDQLKGFGQTAGQSYKDKIVVIELKEEDDLSLETRFEWFEREILKASDAGASAIVIDMDTPGGAVWGTLDLMLRGLSKTKVPTYTYVNTRAISAGSLIAAATDTIYMAPASTIGASTVVASNGAEINKAMQGKIDSTMVSVMRNIAELKGHNPDVVEAFIRSAKKVVVGGITIKESNDLPLSLNAISATEIYGGKPLFAKGVATDLNDLIQQEGLEGEIVTPVPQGAEQLAVWLERIAPFLLLLGIAGAYMEMQTPGLGVPGAVALVAFGLFFYGNSLAGNLAGYEVIAIFVLGLILIGVELFILPGTLFFGIGGFVLMMGALLFAMVNEVDWETLRKGAEGAADSDITWSDVLAKPLMNLGLALVGSMILIGLALVYLPKTRFMNWMVLEDAVGGSPVTAGGAVIEGAMDGAEDARSRIGQTGVVKSGLRPSGKGVFGDEVLDITSGSEFLEAGKKVRIVAQDGTRIVVEEIA